MSIDYKVRDMAERDLDDFFEICLKREYILPMQRALENVEHTYSKYKYYFQKWEEMQHRKKYETD